MTEAANRRVSRAYRFCVDYVKVYQENHRLLKEVHEIIVQATFDIRMKLWTQSELNDKNLMQTIDIKVIPVAA